MSRSVCIIWLASVPKGHNPQPMIADHTLVDGWVELLHKWHGEDLPFLRDSEVLCRIFEPDVVAHCAPLLQNHFLHLGVVDPSAGIRVECDAAHLHLELILACCVVSQPQSVRFRAS